MKTIFEFLMAENDADALAQFRLLRAIRDGTIDLKSVPLPSGSIIMSIVAKKADAPLLQAREKSGQAMKETIKEVLAASRKCNKCKNPLKKGEHNPCQKCRKKTK